MVHAFPPLRIRDEVYVPAVVTPAFEGNQGGFRRGATKDVQLNQALLFTGFWTTPTNGFGEFLSLEKNP